MSDMSAIIDASEIKEAKCVEWKIPQFFQTSQNVVKYTKVISLFQKNWTFTVFPRGSNGTTPEFVILGLVLLHSDSDFSVNLLLDIEDCEGMESKEQYRKADEEGNIVWTWLYRSTLLRIFLEDDVLRGRVMVTCNEDNSNPSSTAVAACQTTTLCNTLHFSRDFQDLLLSGRKSDASIEVQDRLFKVHKLILEACSPVFSAMFDQDKSEKNKGIVKVDDCDPDIFQHFLKCLYSGILENIVPDSLMGLYKISDKYHVSDLKEKCSELMVEELSEDTILGVLDVADMCNDAQLKASAEAFMVKNIKMILRTNAWKKLQSENPLLATEILTKVVEG